LTDPKRDAVVLATMRSHERARYSPRLTQSAGADERHALRMAAEVLNLAREVRIERMWSVAERLRASEEVDDRRITANRTSSSDGRGRSSSGGTARLLPGRRDAVP
ncbi:hypothetical protein ACFQ07_27310, partial [Actinomadura adrarensis]